MSQHWFAAERPSPSARERVHPNNPESGSPLESAIILIILLACLIHWIWVNWPLTGIHFVR